MINIYDATDINKQEIIDIENEERIYRKRYYKPTIDDLVLVRATNVFPVNGIVQPTDISDETESQTSNWTLNGTNLNGKDFIIIEPFKEQINNSTLANINELDTWFDGEVRLSGKAIILMSEETYRMLCYERPNFKEQSKNQNIALYRGDDILALKMLLYNKGYVYFELDENGFLPADDYGDTAEYINQLKKVQEQVATKLQELGQNISYGNVQKYHEGEALSQSQSETIENREKAVNMNVNFYQRIEEEKLYIENLNKLTGEMITGLTPIVEGDIELDGECFATTAIGKVRENQEDAVLLLKDVEIPGFKMMVVADGMGGEQKGELASHIIVTKLQEWFQKLCKEEKEIYYNDVTQLEEILKSKIQEISFDIDWHLYRFWRSNNCMCSNWKKQYNYHKCW